MNDKRFQDLLDRTYRAEQRYSKLLREAEEEYRRRYGHDPSESDNDIWIDSLHGMGSPLSVEVVEWSAREYVKTPKQV